MEVGPLRTVGVRQLTRRCIRFATEAKDILEWPFENRKESQL